ncbi:MAG: DUF6299 family protein [Actinomycetota bacterium]
MRSRRSLTAFAVFAAVMLQVASVSAASPSNDTIGGATAIGAIPFTQTIDTSEATTDAQDAALNELCGAPATDASVWYSLQGTGSDVFIDVSSSNYSAGVLVGSGTPGALELVACGPGAIAFTAEAGVSYFILAIDDEFDGGGNGGQLTISLTPPPPPPVISVTVDKSGTVDTDTGFATVGGTVTCSGEGVEFAGVDGTLKQASRTHARKTDGFFFTEVPCDGGTHPWTAEVRPNGADFAPGTASLNVNAFACNFFSCGEDHLTRQRVILTAA